MLTIDSLGCVHGGKEVGTSLRREIFETDEHEVLNDIPGQKKAGTVGVRLSDGRWITIVTGPGIPIALVEKKTPTVPRRIR